MQKGKERFKAKACSFNWEKPSRSQVGQGKKPSSDKARQGWRQNKKKPETKSNPSGARKKQVKNKKCQGPIFIISLTHGAWVSWFISRKGSPRLESWGINEQGGRHFSPSPSLYTKPAQPKPLQHPTSKVHYHAMKWTKEKGRKKTTKPQDNHKPQWPLPATLSLK